MTIQINHELKKSILLELGKRSQGMRTDLLSTVDKRLYPHNTQKERMLIGSNPEAEPPQGRTRKKIAETT